MNRTKSFPLSQLSCGLALSLALVLVAVVPFAHALEIHHIFSEIDHDGHEHSDFDLCQWVQQHTSNSLVWDVPQLVSRQWLYSRLSLSSDQVYTSFLSTLVHSRGPPTSFFF